MRIYVRSAWRIVTWSGYWRNMILIHRVKRVLWTKNFRENIRMEFQRIYGCYDFFEKMPQMTLRKKEDKKFLGKDVQEWSSAEKEWPGTKGDCTEKDGEKRIIDAKKFPCILKISWFSNRASTTRNWYRESEIKVKRNKMMRLLRFQHNMANLRVHLGLWSLVEEWTVIGGE